MSYKTVSANSQTVDKKWLVVDAEGQTLGRLASGIAFLLRGKHKVNFTPHVDCGDNVIVLNADKVVLTGQKATEKEYVRHTEYPGGQRFTTPAQLMMKKPTKVLENAVKGMLPKNRLGSELFRNLHAFVGTEHPHEAQKPELVDINTVK
jgi:large subunit ribosomal protein L13|tara:strand:- start:1465 stop:1911 length:447 start_codon:yes stop_codon:yes gene_type:complete